MSTLRAHAALKWIEDRHGYEGEDDLAGYGVLNMAGNLLVSPPGGAWKWLEREGTLDHVASQNYVSLPSDLKEVIYVQYADTFVEVPVMTSMSDLFNRVRGPSSNLTYFLAITHTVVSDVVTPRLRIFPTPTVNDTGIYNIFYRAGWTNLDAPNDIVQIPEWCWLLYREMVLAVTLGLYEADDEAERTGLAAGAASKHVAAIWSGPIARTALERDAAIQQNYGLPMSTIVNRSARHSTPYANDTVTLT